MYKHKVFLFIAATLLISLAFNSCKRERTNSIPTLFTTGYWQLGTVIETKYLGDSQISTDTIECDTTQTFTFNKDYTCTYTNFNCNLGVLTGRWQLNDTRLYLSADFSAPNGNGTTYQPFINSHIINIGDFSLVLETGDIQPYYNANDSRTIRRWGFVRVRPKGTQ